MKKVILITFLAFCSFALSPAQAGTVDLLSIWAIDKNNSPGGVDEDGNAVIDQNFANSCVTCVVTTGSIGDITSDVFWSTGSAQDHPADMVNMLAFEGVVIPGLSGVKTDAPDISIDGQKLKTSADFTGYLTVKASSFVWLFQVNDDGASGNQLEIEIGKALDNKEHDISHFTQWAVSEVPIPAAAWLFITGLFGLAGLRKSVKT